MPLSETPDQEFDAQTTEPETSVTYHLTDRTNGNRVQTALSQQEAFGRDHELRVETSGTQVTIAGNSARVQEAIALLMEHRDRVDISKVNSDTDETAASDDTVIEDERTEVAA